MAADKETKQTSPETEEEAKAEAPKKEPKAKKEEKNARKEKKAEEKAAETPKAPEPDFKEELRGANDRYLRLLAEYDNFRKRSQREKDSLYGDIKADTVTKFLPVYDNLVRALAQTTEDEAYRKGVGMIMSQFEQTLEKLGVTKIESLGKTFDPSFHNAVMHVEDAEKGENEIVEVFQEGFLLGEKVIRFAMVKVAN
ncbi:MAG: nucleotide exchange factor GrpE [Oscillospiraceae bacterium]|nr:nucleotide exchange factor GrpE [Oscillospiraceae bacterium]